MRISLRLTKFWQKLVYVGVALAVNLGLAGLVALIFGLGNSPAAVIGSVLVQLVFLATVYIGTRVFRVPLVEYVEPDRAWWRGTARPTAGYVIAVVSVFGAFGALVPSDGHGITVVAVVSFATEVLLVVFYLNSSIRLSRNRMLWTNPSARGPYEATGGWPARPVVKK